MARQHEALLCWHQEEQDEESSSEEVDEEEASRASSSSSSKTPISHGGVSPRISTRLLWLVLGPSLGLACGCLLHGLKPKGMSGAAQRLVGLTVWIALWWVTEAVPLGITSLIPLAMFPALEILPTQATASNYAANLIWLFFGGFQLAFAVENSGLHKRFALTVLRAFGVRPPLLMLGVMFAIGFLSMFLSNTSTTLMILPVVQAIVSSFEAERPAVRKEGEEALLQVDAFSSFYTALMLGVAYSASVGGMGSLIGTPPNGVLLTQAEHFGVTISFSSWMRFAALLSAMRFAAPLSVILILLIWIFLTALYKVPIESLPEDHPVNLHVKQDLGRMTSTEKRVAAVFLLTVLAWMIRKPALQALGWSPKRIGDDAISIAMMVSLFVIKSDEPDKRPLLEWDTTLKRTPWHILLLFGGGFAIAKAFKATGLSIWLGEQLDVLAGVPQFWVLQLTVLLVTFLTEVTSNTATANVLLPVIGRMGCAIGVNPGLTMVPATLAASCAFMLPVATAPNAIVFATGKVSMAEMARAGLVVNVVSSTLITVWTFTWGHLWLDLSSESLGSQCGAGHANASHVAVDA